MVAVASQLVKEEGLMALYKGVSVNFFKGPLASAISFTMYDLMLIYLHKPS